MHVFFFLNILTHISHLGPFDFFFYPIPKLYLCYIFELEQ